MVSSPMAPSPPLPPEDQALLERVAARVVQTRLEVPALLAIESSKPVSLLASQAMIFFEPLIQVFLPGGEVRRFAALMERRETLETLAQLIEARSDAAREERRAARRAPSAPDPRS